LDEEIRLDGGYYTLMAPGKFDARCISFRGPLDYRGEKKLYLNFEILSHPYTGTELFMALNIPRSGVRPGSKYFRAWCIANGGQLPSRNAIMSARIFVGKTFQVVVRTVVPKNAGEEMGADHWYSVVDCLKALVSPDKQEELSS
jgi:hypothetical protein